MTLRIPLHAPTPPQLTATAGQTLPAGSSTWQRDRLLTPDQAALYWLLRIACGLEFIGHGAFGVITKAAWVPYFGVMGIPARWAWKLMPVVGSVDIFLGLLVLLKPLRNALERTFSRHVQSRQGRCVRRS